jgi:hypothetical protein
MIIPHARNEKFTATRQRGGKYFGEILAKKENLSGVSAKSPVCGPIERSDRQERDVGDRRPLKTIREKVPNHTMSLRPFRGRILTTLRAGLALNICSSPVKGLTPLRALVAGLR